MTVEIFTDGSHFKTLGRLGCGGILLINGKLQDEYSLELTPDYLYKVIHTSDVSNPTTEMMGVLQALRRFKLPLGVEKISIYTDYEGVSKWMNDEWKINKPYIRILHSLINEELKKKRIKDITEFHWIKGHQPKSILDPKAKWNNYVDKLAKGE